MTENQQTSETPRSSKRRAIVAGALALIAVGGIGAAATSAAWTDNVFYSASTTAGTFNLQGSLDGSDWKESDDQGAIELVIPATAFENLIPGDSRVVTLHVKNDSDVDATLSDATFAWAGATFTANPTVTLSSVAGTLAPEATTTFTVTVTTPADWAGTNQGKTGTIVVTVGGQAS